MPTDLEIKDLRRKGIYTESIGFNINLPIYNEGELWHPYLNRVAISNNLPSADSLLGQFSPFGEKNWTRTQHLTYDCQKPAARSIILGNGDDWIMSGTTFKGRAPLTNRLMAARRIYSYSMPSSMKTKLMVPLAAYVQDLKVCPECRKEEGEKWYYHTDLQMPDIAICPKHGCVLDRYSGPELMEHYYDEFTPCTVQPYSEILSVFEADFFNAGFQCDATAIKKIILNRLAEMEIGWDHVGPIPSSPALQGIMPEYTQIAKNSMKRYAPTMFFAGLAELFGDVKTLGAEIPPVPQYKEEFMEEIGNEYSLLSPYRDDLVVLECSSCGFIFPSSPFAILNGWDCPYCNRSISDDKLFSRMVDRHTKGKAVFVPPFEGWGRKFRYTDKSTGDEVRANPKTFFDTEFNKAKDELFEKVSKEVAECGDFSLVSRRRIGMQTHLEVRHGKCGQTFSVLEKNLIASPFCRCCEKPPTAKDTFISKVEKISDSFHIEGDFDANEVVLTDGETTFKGQPRTVLSRLERHINPTERHDRSAEYEAVLERIRSNKGKVLIYDDFLDIAPAHIVRKLLIRLRKKGIADSLVPGLFCNAGETHSVEEMQDAQYVKGGKNGCAIGDSALVRIGAIEKASIHAFVLNYVGKTENHRTKGQVLLSSPTLYKTMEPVTPANMAAMMFVGSAWHMNTISAEDRDDMLMKLLEHAVSRGHDLDELLQLSERFPGPTSGKVRELTGRYREDAQTEK